MPELLNDEKTFDSTIAKIADIFHKEFHPTLPPFITLVNHKTQCFHYYGKQYYKNIILDSEEEKGRIPEVIKKVFEIINTSVASVKAWYDKYLTARTREFLNKNSTPTTSNDYTDCIDCFLDLLLNTPISLSYGIVGQAYYTRVPRFFYTGDMFNKYSGVQKSFKEDRILGSDRDTFHKIINTLEEIFWKGFDVKSSIYAPISLYGQIVGVAFVSDTKVKEFDYDKYLRFLQLTKELSITLIKDAKEYEFLSSVLTDLPTSGFDINKSISKNLQIMFNISAACIKVYNEYQCLLFKKRNGELLPSWQLNSCTECSNFSEAINSDTSIVSNSICNKLKSQSSYLNLKSRLHIQKGKENKSVSIFLYFNFAKEFLEIHKDAVSLAIDDVFRLIMITDINRRFHVAYEHDTFRLLQFEKINKLILMNRTSLMKMLFGEKVTSRDMNLFTNDIYNNIVGLFPEKKKHIDKLFTISIQSNKKIFVPAIECIILNLISNTIEYGITFNNTQKVVIKITNNILIYSEEKTNYENPIMVSKWEELPIKMQNYLNGSGIDYEGDMAGLGYYIIQWIAFRFNCNLKIIIQKNKKRHLITVEGSKPPEIVQNNKNLLEIELELPSIWR